MASAPRRNVLFAGFEFQQKLQRGIYLYTKSLISAVKRRGHQTGILSEARASQDTVPLLSNIYHALNDPTRIRVSHRRMLLKYGTHRWLNRVKPVAVANQQSMVTEENLWFLRDVDRFLNVPYVYDTASVVNRLSFEKPLDLGFAGNAGYDTIFTTSPMAVRSAHPRAKLVQTVHDLIPLQVTTHWERTDVFYRRLKACAEHADLMLAVSDYTRNRFLEVFPHAASRIHTVYQPLPADAHALHLSEQPLVQEAVLEKFNLTKGNYCFYVGAIEGRKNIHRLIAAHGIAARGEDFPLVLAGYVDKEYAAEQNLSDVLTLPKPGAPAADAKSDTAKRRRTTRYIGYITEVEKLCLLRNARYFAFPTLSEGFGIPVLEAQTLGCPVLTTNVASIPEVVGQSAALIQDPFNVEEIAVTAKRLMEDDAYRASLRDAGLVNARRFDNETFANNVDALLARL
ncbi:glycosyltransferase family 4 protein [Achromobacter sp. GG226]|uniref:glycosyltransferase family 4 protein n=1 Tax=Verticiella alkaliphila TaxID=2779529 RepID=UPI001C0C78E7|nr:glycosyltransferase family 1 protein [Verticiella sp. GG226]MBU4612099.1 glycosyltransferase family 4 protein [Verticiella sp. GG226]